MNLEGETVMLTGLILAGEPDKRMGGRRESLLPFGGEPLLARQVREMRRVCAEVVIAADNPRPYLRIVDADVRIISDYYPGKGAIGGMHAGFSLARHDAVWVVGCGMPFLSAAAAELLCGMKEAGADAAVPVIGGKPSPLHAVYDKRCSSQALEAIERGDRRAEGLLRALNWSPVDESLFVAAGIEPHFAAAIGSYARYTAMVQALGTESVTER